MELIGVTRMVDGKEVDQFVLRCEIHNHYYNGRPPITVGCPECWKCYYVAQVAMAEGDKAATIDQLEAAIRHVVELAEKGEWDFIPNMRIESIDHDA